VRSERNWLRCIVNESSNKVLCGGFRSIIAEVTTGNALSLKAIAQFDDNSIRDATKFMNWRSLNNKIARVNLGVVAPVRAGEVVLVAEDPNGFAYAYKKW
jgi:hypothetical protein